jgi:hypothetical protein
MVRSSGPTSPRDEFAKDGIVLTTRVRRRAPRRTPRPGTGGPAARPARVLRRTRCTAAGPWIGATGRIGAPCSRRGRAYLGSHAAWPRLKDRCITLRPAVVLLPVSNPRKRPGGCCVWAKGVAGRLLGLLSARGPSRSSASGQRILPDLRRRLLDRTEAVSVSATRSWLLQCGLSGRLDAVGPQTPACPQKRN